MPKTHIVAVLRLGGSLEDAASSLAADLGQSAYDVRVALAGGCPAIVLATPDGVRAVNLVDKIKGRGHRAAAIDRDAVASSDECVALVDFELAATELVAASGRPDRLRYDEIRVMLRASHRESVTTTQKVTERKLRPAMALATGGMVLSKKTTREVTSKTEEREQVLYLFRSSTEAPWILRERGARYAGLGAGLGRTALENFGKTVQELRTRAPSAAYDERLVASRSIRGVAEGVPAVDLLAHALAIDLE